MVNKFKVGQIIYATEESDNEYGITNYSSNCICLVKEICDDYEIVVEVISNTNSWYIEEKYYVNPKYFSSENPRKNNLKTLEKLQEGR